MQEGAKKANGRESYAAELSLGGWVMRVTEALGYLVW